MRKQRLGNTDLDISVVGFGAWAVGGPWEWGWGAQDDADSVAAIHRALEHGVNWIDTAAVYGLGHSEQVVARALKGVSERPFVFTKCGLVWNDEGEVSGRLKAHSVRAEIEASLKRLEVDTIDLYQVHWPNPAEDIEEAWRVLADAQQAGKLRWIGVSNFSCEHMDRVREIAPISSMQPPFSAGHQDVAAEILPYCREHGVGVIVYSPMMAGLLTGKMTRERVEGFPADDWRRKAESYKEPNLTRNLKLQDILVEIGNELDTTAAAVAVAWTLTNPAVTGAIVGARRPDQVDGFVEAGTLELPPSALKRVADFVQENP